jgi:Fe2+ transport system protein FeoA
VHKNLSKIRSFAGIGLAEIIHEFQMIVIDNKRAATMSLDAATKGSRLIVVGVPPGRSRMQLIRLGILEGEAIRVIERMPGGTMVVEKNRREIAIGAALAKTLLVASVTEEHSDLRHA